MHSTIAFLTSAHLPFDDRIYYHMAKSLCKLNKVLIIATTQQIRQLSGNIEIIGEDKVESSKSEKVKFFVKWLIEHEPECIVCAEPLPIIAAYKYKRKTNKKVKIINDVTEWYPSKKNLEGKSITAKFFVFFKLLLFNIYSSVLADGFIFGEYYKGFPYRMIFPLKKWKIISYYPDLKYINYKEPNLLSDTICLGFTGKISIEKGIRSIIDVAKAVKAKRPELKVKLKIIGWLATENDKMIFDHFIDELPNIDIELLDRQNFTEFSDKLHDINVFLDLRQVDFENSRCLPIKLFYYMACGRPVIYSDLKAIRREVEVNQFGYLVKPDDCDTISNFIIDYVDNPELYLRHSHKAREMAEHTYNWQNIESVFLDYIKQYQN